MRMPVASLVCLVAGALLALATGARETSAEGRVLALDPGRSRLYVVTHRAGLLGFLGHEHAILATGWVADLCVDPGELATADARVTVPVRGLRIDSERARALAGLRDGPAPDTVHELQQKLLGPRYLAAAAQPELRFESTAVSRQGPDRFVVAGRLTIRGVTRPVSIPVTAMRTGDGGLRARGRVAVRQSRFGIEPESVAGVVNVADEMDVHFDVHARATGEVCRPWSRQ